MPFKQPVLNGKFSIPINLLLINIDDALYTTKRSFNIFFARTAKYTGDVFVLDEETDPDTLATTSALSEGIAASQVHIEVLRKGLTTTLQKTDLVRLQTKKNDRQAELEKVKLLPPKFVFNQFQIIDIISFHIYSCVRKSRQLKLS